MIHPALKGKKLVFDVEGKPELAEAIIDRLRELGANKKPSCWPNTSTTVSWGVGGDFFGFSQVAAPTACCYKNYTLSTLSDLYDLPENPELRLEVGKRYRDRCGQVSRIARQGDHGNFRAEGETGCWFLPNGEWTGERGTNYDLISEVTTHTLTIDGIDIEISDESYMSLKEHFGREE